MENGNDNDEKVVEVKEEELRASVITEYGFSETDDKERIDKAVARERKLIDERNGAIGQKIKHRTDFEEYKKSNPPKAEPPQEKKPEEKGLSKEDVDAQVNSALDKSFLDDQGFPEDVRKVIENVAKLNGVSAKEAAKDPYAAAKIETWKKQKESDDAALSRKNRADGGGGAADPNEIPDFDLSTEQGRKDYDAWKADAIKAEMSGKG